MSPEEVNQMMAAREEVRESLTGIARGLVQDGFPEAHAADLVVEMMRQVTLDKALEVEEMKAKTAEVFSRFLR